MLARRSMSSRIWTVLLAAGPWILSLNWWDWIPTHLFDREAAGKTSSVLTLYCDRGIPMIRRDRRTTYLTILAGFAQKSPKRRGCGRSSAEAGKEQGKGTGRIRIEDELDLRIKSEGRPMCSAPEGGGEGGFTKGKVKSGREGERVEEERRGRGEEKKRGWGWVLPISNHLDVRFFPCPRSALAMDVCILDFHSPRLTHFHVYFTS